jgi:hypothetical protein
VNPDPRQEDAGLIWLLGSDELVRYSYVFLRQCRAWITKLHARYEILWNCVDARNEVHVRWLVWCGFTILETIEEYGVERRPFYGFASVREG